MKIATKIKQLDGFTGDAALYRLSPLMKIEHMNDAFLGGIEYVVVSATIALFTGAETYIFPANKDGEVLDWGELKGSYRGGLSHSKALKNAGYTMGGK